MKTFDTRISDAIAYLSTNVSAALAAEVKSLYTSSPLQHLSINYAISLGGRDDHGTTAFASNSAHRNALRALLLCQRIYYSPIWKKYSGLTASIQSSDALPNTLIGSSKAHWLNRSEQEILQALQVFTHDPTAVANDLAAAAEQGVQRGPGKFNLHSVTRTHFTGASTATCYVAVMMWLFRANMVSLPWLIKFAGANTQASLTHAFGTGTVIRNSSLTINQNLALVPRGQIVHMWKDNTDPNWNGHWVVSLGGGAAAGECNVIEPNCTKTYCTTLTLDGQFTDYVGGTVVVIDPTQIPNRV